MTDMNAHFADPDRVRQYLENGPPAFTPGHAGLMQMIGVLLGETMPQDGTLLVIGAGGGLETRYLAGIEPQWRFVGVDPAAAMLDLARATAGDVAGERLRLIEGTVADAPDGPFDAATCILVLGLVPDNGAKLELLCQARQRLRPGAPFVLVDQCLDRNAADFTKRLDRYAAYARRSGVDDDVVAGARAGVAAMESVVPAQRNEQLLAEAGFDGTELFYLAMGWRGWLSYA
ncbi:tRNA (cmo5U34)-methyltransferase [Novosphingobium chloroacetimidivorans]|uniref:tRNA (Cmo5U34)-methyltransferase n=1 Tax=Novosphingobium chloroacetimidivorans TaxID=1428314 RepID=A0A7W7NVV6_9SPHN|nr:class I SAM-dependent methyltransferase [Novosphingobium chloroacetimidivorans]MBB4857527.1 tRNA (cmo5U34)-methyltransferase [Novosphingobium chloroacetimidivorans]